MKDIIIAIGNSDNKLTQIEWSNYVKDVNHSIDRFCDERHFFGGSSNWERWQNVAWIVTCDEGMLPYLKERLTKVRQTYRQDSVAMTVGDTEFI